MTLSRIYEINLVPFLNQFGFSEINEIPDQVLNVLAYKWKFDAVYLMGVWTRTDMASTEAMFPDLFDPSASWEAADIMASPFSVRQYKVPKPLGGNASLRKFKKRLNDRGVKLILDFVPNHTALDHHWVNDHNFYYVHNHEGELSHGQSSSHEVWPDVAQLDYTHPHVRMAMVKELTEVSRLCDGVRCDMAHLVLNEVFYHNWHQSKVFGQYEGQEEFWTTVRNKLGKDFYLLAEAYGGHEYRLAELGFDAVYDKDNGFYDRLVRSLVKGEKDTFESDIKGHVKGCAGAMVQTPFGEKNYGDCLVKFLENHDEERAMKVFGKKLDLALETMVEQYDEPHGPLLIHNGQLEGRKIKCPVQLANCPVEKIDWKVLKIYEKWLGAEKSWKDLVPKKKWRSVMPKKLQKGHAPLRKLPVWARY